MQGLLIEDDAGIQAFLVCILARHGVQTTIVGDGIRAIHELRTNLYAVVLLDLMLPEVNGFEVLQEMKRHVPELMQRTIVITAATEAALRGFDQHQVCAVLRKPFDLVALDSSICRCLYGGQALTG